LGSFFIDKKSTDISAFQRFSHLKNIFSKLTVLSAKYKYKCQQLAEGFLSFGYGSEHLQLKCDIYGVFWNMTL
jgi:hypothetical protein